MIAEVILLLLPILIFVAFLYFQKKPGWQKRKMYLAGCIGFLIGWPIAVMFDHFIKGTQREPSFWLYLAFCFVMGVTILCIELVTTIKQSEQRKRDKYQKK